MKFQLFIVMVLGLAAGSAWGAGGMTEVTYMDQEADAGGYVTRYLVTDRFLRMDYGRDREDFVLLDRREKRAYNVNHERHEVLVFEMAPLTIEKPKEWDTDDDLLSDRDSQKKLNLIVNGKVCTRITASERFLPEVARALGEFGEVMAATHATAYLATPPEQREACDLARLVLEPRRWFKYGLTLDEVHYSGFSRRLLNYQAGVAVRPKVFEVPDHYRQINMKAQHGGQP
ncbi:MAG: hypothetical protein HZA59_01180 [Hydrogenophilales bacterium]|nr:hypothetical protein [Hydrogenophilales bacterium]